MKLQRTVCKKHRLRIQEATEGENWEGYHSHIGWMVAQMVKNLPAMQETQVQSLGQEDPRRREWQPTQYSCLENPMERGVWWVRVHGVAKSQTWLKHLSMHALRQHIKKQRHYFVDKGPSSQSYGFSSSHVWMWELDYKENWASKNWCFWTVVLEKTLESPLGCNEIQPILKEITPEY